MNEYVFIHQGETVATMKGASINLPFQDLAFASVLDNDGSVVAVVFMGPGCCLKKKD
jgi:hypothetical protein